jgi:hypothetical protein
MLVAGAAGCQSTPPDIVPPAPPPPSAPTFHIEPREHFLSVGDTARFHAVSTDGTPVAVTWRVDQPYLGRISSDGLFTADSCADGTTAIIFAKLAGGAGDSAIARASMNLTGPAASWIQSLNSIPVGYPVVFDSMAGTVSVRAQLNFKWRACYGLSALRLEVLAGPSVTPLDSLILAPNTWGPEFPTFNWNTTGFPNGTYTVRVASRFTIPLWNDYSNTGPVTVTVKNP